MTTYQVAADSDDCYRQRPGGGTGFHTSLAVFFAGYDGAQQVADHIGSGARFLNVAIDPGSTIESAFLVVTCRQNTANNTVNTRLRAEKDINSATFSDQADFDTRTWTTEFVRWDALAAWTDGIEYTSPDIKACIQEVIDLPSWASGNPLTILWDDFEQRSTAVNGTYRLGSSHNHDPSEAPKLVITVVTAVPRSRAVIID